MQIQTSKFSPLVPLKKKLLTRYLKPSRSLFFCQREVKSAAALTSRLVRVKGEICRWAGKGNSLAFRSTASQRLAKSTYSYKYASLNHRYKTNTSTIHSYATGGLRRGQLQVIMCRPATRNMSFTHSPWNICHCLLYTSPSPRD